jgi:diadenosine tetraphosphate (Ap4A) HIT family hydrolase
MTLGKVMRTVLEAQKLNIAALGNQVSQLHIHHVARSSADAAWPRPVWGVGVAEPYETTAARERIAAIQAAVSHHLTLEFPGS